MFILDKLLSPLLTPLGLALALIGLGWLLLAFGRRRTGLLAVAVACIGLYAVSTDFVAQRLSGLLERQYPPVPVASLPRADAIILLGGMTDPALPPRQAPDLNEHADRAVLPMGETLTRYHVAIDVDDRAGVLAAVATAFAENDVSIQTVRQEGRDEDAQLVVVSHQATDAQLSATVAHLRTMDYVREVTSVMRVEGDSE